MQLCTSAPDTDAAGTTPAAAAQQMYYAATTGETVTPTLLKGLVAGQPVVTPAWAQAAAAKVVWSGQLPPPQDYTPERLLLPCAEADASSSQDQEGQQELVLASWHAPSAGLLSSYSLAFEVGCQVRAGRVSSAVRARLNNGGAQQCSCLTASVTCTAHYQPSAHCTHLQSNALLPWWLLCVTHIYTHTTLPCQNCRRT